MIAAVNNTASESWLNSYRGQIGITYPMIFDATSKIFQSYQVGPQYGNTPPTYIIIDPKGVVRYRADNKFNRTAEIVAAIRSVLKAP